MTAMLALPREDTPSGAIGVLDGAERRALGVLAGSGLVPPLRWIAGPGVGPGGYQDRDGGRAAGPITESVCPDRHAMG
jgi:hypothetical protein